MSNFFSCPRSISVVWYLFFLSCTVSAEEWCNLTVSTVNVPGNFSAGCSLSLEVGTCNGHCKSWTTPASPDELLTNPHQRFVSRSRCCGMAESYIIQEELKCGKEVQTVKVRTATLCLCESHSCGKDND